jgi:site-specific recombinase XerD
MVDPDGSVDAQLWLFEPALKVDMGRLKQFRDDLSRREQAENTVVGYACDWKNFLLWCTRACRSPRPATAETVELYVTYQLQVEKLKVVTVERRVSAIRDAHRAAGCPLGALEGVRAVLSGARRSRKERPEAKEPLTAAQLRRVSAKLRALGAARDVRDRALMVLGFASALRRSNLSALHVRDVAIVRKGVVVEVRSSKTDQKGVGVRLGVHRGLRADTCPARTLRDWLRVRGESPGPLFTVCTSGGNVTRQRLGGEGIAAAVKRAVSLIGLDPAMYAGHSLRAGCATTGFEEGASDSAIMKRTGHRKHSTLQRYIRPADPFAGVNPLGRAL